MQLKNNITELENQKTVLQNYINLLFIIIPNLGNLQSILKKIDSLLENPKIILIFLCYNFFSKDNEKKSNEFDNFPKDNK
jgi:hypothetical protein